MEVYLVAHPIDDKFRSRLPRARATTLANLSAHLALAQSKIRNRSSRPDTNDNSTPVVSPVQHIAANFPASHCTDHLEDSGTNNCMRAIAPTTNLAHTVHRSSPTESPGNLSKCRPTDSPTYVASIPHTCRRLGREECMEWGLTARQRRRAPYNTRSQKVRVIKVSH